MQYTVPSNIKLVCIRDKARDYLQKSIFGLEGRYSRENDSRESFTAESSTRYWNMRICWKSTTCQLLYKDVQENSEIIVDESMCLPSKTNQTYCRKKHRRLSFIESWVAFTVRCKRQQKTSLTKIMEIDIRYLHHTKDTVVTGFKKKFEMQLYTILCGGVKVSCKGSFRRK